MFVKKRRFIQYCICRCDAGTTQNCVFFNILNWSEMLKQILSILYHILHEHSLLQLHFDIYYQQHVQTMHPLPMLMHWPYCAFSRYVPVADVTSRNSACHIRYFRFRNQGQNFRYFRFRNQGQNFCYFRFRNQEQNLRYFRFRNQRQNFRYFRFNFQYFPFRNQGQNFRYFRFRNQGQNFRYFRLRNRGQNFRSYCTSA